MFPTLHQKVGRAKITQALTAVDESAFANATRGGSWAHPDQSRGLARRRNLRAISGVGASSPILPFFLGGGVALHERLVGIPVQSERLVGIPVQSELLPDRFRVL